MKKAISIFLAVVMVLALVACGNSAAPNAPAATNNGSETAGTDSDTIKIGYVSDLTGATALWGTAGQYGAELAVKDINEAGGVLGGKNAALFTIAGNTNSESVGSFIRDAINAKGANIVADEQCQEGDVDFRAQLTNIKAKNPDIIFVVMNDYAKNATFAKQAREMGIECTLMGHDGWDSAQLASEAQGALEGCLYVSRIGFNSPDAKAFGERVAKEYGISMEAECLFGYDGVNWIVDAINRAGSADPTAIRDALEQTEVFEGLIGTLVMDPATHNPSMACALYECHGDSFEFKEIIEAQK